MGEYFMFINKTSDGLNNICGKNIAKLRTALQISQRELASRMQLVGIDIDKNGRDLMIGFNPKFLIDALRVIDDETISIYLMNPKSPCFIRDDENNYIYLVLPVNFTTVS